MHGLLRCNINTGIHARTRGVDVSLRDVTIAHMGNGAREFKWRHAPEARGRFWEFWRKSVELRTRLRTGRLTFASSPKPKKWPCGGCHTCFFLGGGDRKASIERLCLSPYVEKPFNLKVIESFVLELRSRKCFSCFGIPMFYVYMLWTFYIRFAYPYHGYGTISHQMKALSTCTYEKNGLLSTGYWSYEILIPLIKLKRNSSKLQKCGCTACVGYWPSTEGQYPTISGCSGCVNKMIAGRIRVKKRKQLTWNTVGRTLRRHYEII